MSATATRTHPLLGRAEIAYPLPDLKGKRIVVTGSGGAIGQALLRCIDPCTWVPYDVRENSSVLDPVRLLAATKGADVVLHLAADKHAPAGERFPVGVAAVNIQGTANVVDACLANGVKTLVFASTCKAAQPETVYGASKLVGERIVLNAGYTVGRLFNVVESSKNVFAHWYDQASTGDGSLQVTPCQRYFISIGEACSFLLSCIDRPAGRYIPNPGMPLMMQTMARRWAEEQGLTDAEFKSVPARKGDRLVEPFYADCEWTSPDGNAFRVHNPHDQEIHAAA